MPYFGIFSHIFFNGTEILETNDDISLCSLICRIDRFLYDTLNSTAYKMCSQATF